MAKASINFQKAKRGGLKHNDRTEKVEPDYLLPKEFREENIVNRSAKDAEELLRKLKAEANANYKEVFGQKNQASSYVIEAVINLNKEHTKADLDKVVKDIEEETGFTCVQYASHGDEGRLATSLTTKELFAIHNRHAHLTFFTLDKKTGQQLYRKEVTKKQLEKNPNLKPFNKTRMSKMQDIVAKSLNMERGKRGSKVPRLSAKAYREAQRLIEEEVKKINLKLRDELQSNKATRADYAILEAKMEVLKKDIKAKEFTIEELQIRVREFESSKAEDEKNNLVAELLHTQLTLKEQEEQTAHAEKTALLQKLVTTVAQAELAKQTVLVTKTKEQEEARIIELEAEVMQAKTTAEEEKSAADAKIAVLEAQAPDVIEVEKIVEVVKEVKVIKEIENKTRITELEDENTTLKDTIGIQDVTIKEQTTKIEDLKLFIKEIIPKSIKKALEFFKSVKITEINAIEVEEKTATEEAEVSLFPEATVTSKQRSDDEVGNAWSNFVASNEMAENLEDARTTNKF